MRGATEFYGLLVCRRRVEIRISATEQNSHRSFRLNMCSDVLDQYIGVARIIGHTAERRLLLVR